METTSDYKRKSWAPTNDPTENQEETVFYTSLKQAGKTAEFINFFFKDGNQKALPASSVSGLEFDPGKGLVSIFCGYASVLIHGKNMGELYKKLLLLKITEVREFSVSNMTSDPKECFITGIEFNSTLSGQAIH